MSGAGARCGKWEVGARARALQGKKEGAERPWPRHGREAELGQQLTIMLVIAAVPLGKEESKRRGAIMARERRKEGGEAARAANRRAEGW